MTKRAIIILLSFVGFFSICDSSAQTYYYERVAIVKNGVKTSAAGDGHFITFTSKGCYDSDKEGISENTGFREYQTTANNIINYYGESYFGTAHYYFSADRKRLNIKCDDGNKVYVYELRNAPVGVTKSKRNISARNYNSGSTSVVVPQTNTYSNPSSTSTDNSTSRSRYGYYTCPTCNGSGKCPICHGTNVRSSYYTGESRICTQCNDKGQCPSCNGSGKKYGIVQ